MNHTAQVMDGFPRFRPHKPQRNAARQQRCGRRDLVAAQPLTKSADVGDPVIDVADFVMALRIIGGFIPLITARVGHLDRVGEC